MPKPQFEKITHSSIMGMFYMLLEQGSMGWVNRLAFKTESDMDGEDYAFLGMSPAMVEWIGGRTIEELREFSFRIANKDYEATLRIRDKDMRRDKTGQIEVRVGELADRTNQHPGKLISTLIEQGESSTCYDGQYFFDTDHIEGDSGAQSNRFTFDAVDAAKPTVPEFRDAIMQSVEKQYGFKDDRGEPINEGATSFDVMVPVNHWATAKSAVTLPLINNGESNIITASDDFKINVVPNPRLTWTTKFATFRNDGRVKPFILQEEMPVELTGLGEGSDHFFKHKEHLFSADWAGNVGYGYWQHASLTEFT